MKINPTPGPWICHSGMVWRRISNIDIPIARMDRDTPHTTPTERDANAYLISAVHDLKDSLLEMIDMVTDNRTHGPEIGRACAALAKSKGELPPVEMI